MSVLIDTLVAYRFELAVSVAVLAVLVILLRVYRRVRRWLTPTRIHPKLQKYSVPRDEELAADRRDALQIIATSSTNQLAGYEIVRQVEAVFVEGYRSQEEALAALKARAARQGANAVINVSQIRSAAGKCTAQGDAVLLRPSAN